MIIVEGPDGAGKTTLIRHFTEDGIPIAPRVVSKDTKAMTNLQDWVDNNLDEGFQGVIYDRYRLISEPIYGTILRDHPEPGFADLKWLGPRLRRFYELEPIIIYCLPPLDVVVENIKNDPDNQVVLPYIRRIYSAYIAKAAADLEFAPGTVRVWDYTSTPRINDRPFWFNSAVYELKERLK